MLIYYIIYSLPIFAMLYELRGCRAYEKYVILFFFVFIFVLFRGLRWGVGTDWDQFYNCFENANWNNIFSYYRYDDGESEKMEFGYMILNVVIKIFGGYTLFLVLTNLFVVGSWAFFSLKIIPRRSIFAFSMILATNLIFPVRLQLAGCVVAWALYCLTKKQIIRSLLIVVVAYTIHKASLFVLPIVVGIWLKENYSGVFSVVLTSISFVGDFFSVYIPLIVLLIVTYLPENLQGNILTYSDCEMSWNVEKSFISMFFALSLNMAMVLLFLYARKQFGIKERKTKYVFNIFFCSYLFWTFFSRFFSSPTLVHFTRVSEFFSLGFAFCFTISCFVIEKKKILAPSVVYSFFILYYIYKVHFLISSTPFPTSFFPYKTIFY